MIEEMKVLIACEYSGTVRDAFTALGYDATSCDLLPSETPGKHYQGSVMDILNDGWDLLIGHPPCTYLSNAGGHYLKDNPERMQQMKDACIFFNTLLNCSIPYVALENPVQHGEARKYIRKYNQKIQPFYFGDREKKTICLWLKGLKCLMPTKILTVEPKGMVTKSDGRKYYYWHHQSKSAKERARFFPGIAAAMAEQWGNQIINDYTNGFAEGSVAKNLLKPVMQSNYGIQAKLL